MSALTLPPLSLYVHIPWCVRKCPYCDFNSHARDSVPQAQYLQALKEDLLPDLQYVQGRALQSIFFGGGTPSLMSGDFYQQLLDFLRDQLAFADDIEITLEANPGTLEQGRFEAYRRAGINRLSIGVQSFNPRHLEALGRIHSADEAVRAAHAARAAGIDNINLDLMHALPGQSRAEALDDLAQAIALNPTHLSWYELTIEPNTAFYRAPPEQPDVDAMADTEEAGFALLARHGFARYEISAFARHGQRARHNLNYWQFGDYLAIGAGAHAKITLPQQDRLLRYHKTRLPEHYLAGQGSRHREVNEIGPQERVLEYFLNTLRLLDGAPAASFTSRTGQPLAALTEALTSLKSKHLLSPEDHKISCTDLGFRHLNTVLAGIEAALN